MGISPKIVTIPVGSIDELKYPEEKRKSYSLITASRLADEKHVDWLIEAVAGAKNVISDITLDIYGKGGEESHLQRRIKELGAQEYIHLCGQQNLTEVYQNYEAYVSASQSEGFGLTLLEAIAAGLPIIGFDARYGNQNFIDSEENGYKISVDDHMDSKSKIHALEKCMIRLFTEADLEAFHTHSYQKAEKYLTSEVEHLWADTINQII